jgi:hypothetical protein
MFAEVTLGGIVGLSVGLGVGVASSWVVWRYLLRLKPRLTMSTQIACQREAGDGDHHWRYLVKVVNHGRRQVINLRVECQLAGRKPIQGGFIRTVTALPVKTSSHSVLGLAKQHGAPFGIPPVWHVVMYADEDFREVLSADERVLVTLLATDARSGTTVAYRTEYEPSTIVEGQFPFGLDSRVFPVEETRPAEEFGPMGTPVPSTDTTESAHPVSPSVEFAPAADRPEVPGQRALSG